MTENQIRRLNELESYARNERYKQETASQKEVFTNILAWCILIRKDE